MIIKYCLSTVLTVVASMAAADTGTVIPANLNPDLREVIHSVDYDNLSQDREKIRTLLATLSPDSYGYDEKQMCERLLDAPVSPVTPDGMIGYRRVRSIQINSLGIFSYPYFSCRFRKKNGKVFFEKTTGSQRKSGYLYQNTPESLIFLGGASVNGDPQTTYGSESSVAGTLYKTGPRTAIMLFATDDSAEIYELTK
ncbi:MAG: DUF4893 domain-containing protein [Muribaculaceae bacterium]|nr:DUF4893 domain-containing protein [Muribaculaceae bacterium]